MTIPPVPTFDPKYVGDDRLFDFDCSGFPDLYGEAGATATVAVVSGAGLTPSGGTAWDQTLKKAQQRFSAGAAGVTYLLRVRIVTTPNGYDVDGFAYLPVVADPTVS